MDLGLSEADVLPLLDDQSRAMLTMLGPDVPWEVAGATLASEHDGLYGRGESLWNRVLAEFRDFLCTESEAYADLRREWEALRDRSAALAVTALTAALASDIGVASTVIAPLVVWAVLAAIRMGGRAFCDAG